MAIPRSAPSRLCPRGLRVPLRRKIDRGDLMSQGGAMLAKILRKRRGQGIGEYGLVIVLTGLVAVMSLNRAGESTDRIYNNLASDISAINDGSYSGAGTGGDLPPGEGGGDPGVFR
jgi:hypothetical protein